MNDFKKALNFSHGQKSVSKCSLHFNFSILFAKLVRKSFKTKVLEFGKNRIVKCFNRLFACFLKVLICKQTNRNMSLEKWPLTMIDRLVLYLLDNFRENLFLRNKNARDPKPQFDDNLVTLRNCYV